MTARAGDSRMSSDVPRRRCRRSARANRSTHSLCTFSASAILSTTKCGIDAFTWPASSMNRARSRSAWPSREIERVRWECSDRPTRGPGKGHKPKRFVSPRRDLPHVDAQLVAHQRDLVHEPMFTARNVFRAASPFRTRRGELTGTTVSIDVGVQRARELAANRVGAAHDLRYVGC